jgi:hypothetical protein
MEKLPWTLGETSESREKTCKRTGVRSLRCIVSKWMLQDNPARLQVQEERLEMYLRVEHLPSMSQDPGFDPRDHKNNKDNNKKKSEGKLF